MWGRARPQRGGQPPTEHRDWAEQSKTSKGRGLPPTEHRDWGAEQDLKGEGNGHPQIIEIGVGGRARPQRREGWSPTEYRDWERQQLVKVTLLISPILTYPDPECTGETKFERFCFVSPKIEHRQLGEAHHAIRLQDAAVLGLRLVTEGAPVDSMHHHVEGIQHQDMLHPGEHVLWPGSGQLSMQHLEEMGEKLVVAGQWTASTSFPSSRPNKHWLPKTLPTVDAALGSGGRLYLQKC